MRRHTRSRIFFACFLAIMSLVDASEDSFLSGIKVMFRAFQQCEEQEMLTCLKIRALKSIDRILQQDEITVIDGVSFKKVLEDESGRHIDYSFKNLNETALPTDPEERDDAVDELFLDRISRFFNHHSLKIDLGNSNSNSESDAVEGRRRGGIGGGGGGGNKKGNGGIILATMMAGGMGAMFLKGVAVLAGKALLVAKMALVLAVVLGLSKLLGSEQGHEKPHYHVVSPHEGAGGFGGGNGGSYGGYGGGGLYGRSVDDFHPHVLAYNGHLGGGEGSVGTETVHR